MKGLDWNSIITEFAVTRHTVKDPLRIARDLLRFIEKGSFTHIDESVLLRWLQEQLPHTALETLFVKLSGLKRFINFLEERGYTAQGLFRRVWERPDLLVLLKGPHLYDAGSFQLEEYWQQTLAAFETSLCGFSLPHQARILRVASGFAGMLQGRGTRCPTEDSFFGWLDRRLVSFRISVVERDVSGLERFCQFLKENCGCPSNPVREWRKLQIRIGDALRRRRQCEPPLLRPPQFQSFLSARIEAFLAHKRTLGYKYGSVHILGFLDRHVKKEGVNDFIGLDRRFFSAFLNGALVQRKVSSRRRGIGLLRKFFQFLIRRGDVSKELNPGRFLPHLVQSPYYSPYIFTLKEIGAVLACLREKLVPSTFDGQMLFTLFHLVYACGLRISEAVRLKVQDVNLEENTLFIRETKFGKSRHIPLGQRATEYLHTYGLLRLDRLGRAEGTAPFFIRAKGRRCYSRSSLKSLFRRACRTAGITQKLGARPRIHDLRHSMAVHRLYKWYLESADPQERLQLLSLYMGHQKVTYTEHYLHLAQDLLRIAGRPMEPPIETWLRERQKREEED